MAMRFRKTVKLGRGLRLNIGKKSASISLGGKFGGITLSTKGKATKRASLPGTGISFIETENLDE